MPSVTFIPGNNIFARCRNYSVQHDQFIQKQQQSDMQQIINGDLFTTPGYNTCNSQTLNYKQLNSSSDVNQQLTQTQRAVNAIKYSVGVGGKISFGNTALNRGGVSFLGKTEGQPGGIRLAVRNRF